MDQRRQQLPLFECTTLRHNERQRTYVYDKNKPDHKVNLPIVLSEQVLRLVDCEF